MKERKKRYKKMFDEHKGKNKFFFQSTKINKKKMMKKTKLLEQFLRDFSREKH